jgi:hypothetical protein
LDLSVRRKLNEEKERNLHSSQYDKSDVTCSTWKNQALIGNNIKIDLTRAGLWIALTGPKIRNAGGFCKQ